MVELSGKVAVVTGAGRGIGKGIALAYGAAGMKVVVASRTRTTVDGVCAEIQEQGGTAFGVECDVGKREQVFAMIEQTVNAFGTVDVLVNVAQSFGPSEKPSPSEVPTKLEDFDDDHWDNIYRTGLKGSLWGMQAAFPHLKKHGGKIINFSSIAGQQGRPLSSAYNCTKEGVRALTRTAAREWGQYKINANCITPLMMTEPVARWKISAPAEFSAFEQSTALGRIGDPIKDVSGLVRFLASSDSDYLTGMTFMLDGGCFMYP
jgi:NAD(P)-dependent dehydrogenase (short-subunit alcohol dehydrogenase family)